MLNKMPKIPMDYSKCSMYRIVCNDVDITDCYEGHTTNIVKRKSQHKNSSKKSDAFVYQSIRDNGGFDNWSFIEIEVFPCSNLNEALTRERYWLEFYEATLNKVVPTRTKKEYYKDNADVMKERSKIFHHQNQEKIKEYKKEFHLQNKDAICKRSFEYQNQHKEKIKEYKKEHYQKNKDVINNKIKEYQREYRHKNKDIILAKHKEFHQRKKDEINKKAREKYQRKKEELKLII